MCALLSTTHDQISGRNGEPRLSVSVLGPTFEPDCVVAVTRAETGLPLSFRVLRAIFPIMACLSLSWIPRMVVLLWFPHWVDPAFSPVYYHRKVLRVASRRAVV